MTPRKNPPPLQPGSLVAAYIRDSGGTEQEMSEAQQEAVIRAHCAKNGYILTRIFKDARSGGSTTGRTGFEAMIDALRTNPPEQAVIIWKMSRFSRDLTDAQYYKADLRRRGLQIISLQDNLPAGPEGALVENILDWANARYLADLSSDIKRGKRHIVQAYHVWPGGAVPFGYTGVDVVIGTHRDGSQRTAPRLDPHPVNGPLVTRAFELRSQGRTYREIHDALHLFDWITGYRYLFRRRIYLGIYDYAGLHIDDFCPPLTDPVTWEAVQRINTARRERHPGHHPRQVNSRFWLSGLLVCANCGANLVGQSYTANGKRYDYYVCSRRLSSLGLCSAAWVRKTSIEDRVILVLQETILQPAVLADLVAEARTIAGSLQAEQEARQAQNTEKLTQVRAEIGRVVAAITAAGHSASLLEHLARLEDEQRSLLEAVSAAAEPPPPVEIDPYAFSQSALDILTHGDDGDMAQIVRGFVQRIVVTPRPLHLDIEATIGGPVRAFGG